MENNRLFSLHWELRTILYLGVLLLSGGLGIAIYKNIDSIGHTAVVTAIGAISAGCYWYCFRNVETRKGAFDYILLLGSLTMVTFVGYLQFQYQTFGPNLRLAALIPMVLLFATAYYFDHIGILSLAITNLAAWMGIIVTPTRILADNDLSSERLIFTGIGLAIILLLAAMVSAKRNIKAHFEFTYLNFGMHTGFISLLAGMFHFERFFIFWALPVAGLAWYCYDLAIKRRSFYIILITVLYSYIGICYTITMLSMNSLEMGSLIVLLMYYILSAFGLIRLLMHLNRKLKNA